MATDGRVNNRDEAPEIYITAWTNTPADVNCLTVAGGMPGQCCCGLQVGGSGTVVVTRRDGTSVTIPASLLQPGKYWRGQFRALGAASTATDVMIYW